MDQSKTRRYDEPPIGKDKKEQRKNERKQSGVNIQCPP
jgi:hypothetical protein